MSDFAKIFQQMLDSGQDMAKAFNPGAFNTRTFEDAMPTMPSEMMEMFFGKTLNQGGLDAKTRLFLTLAALTVTGAQAESQIRLTVRHALEAGATAQEIAEVIAQMAMFGGVPAMTKAMELAQDVIEKEAET
ncbi:MAG: carboxymuconolactone decarboxylase family protein [Rhodobacteraceae bacterium]|nr:carboxymuconolactone decarboxylase family protein [Paracoccaceae bacterium]